jgi:molybdenum cofactor guanylyltransferase
MGTDKALLTREGNTWVETAVEKMVGLNLPVMVSVNASQFDAYTALFPGLKLIADDISLTLNGPLLGILSSHLQYPMEDLFVLACDMPLMSALILQELRIRYLLHTSYHAHIYTNDNEAEPLCAIYTAKGLSMILTMMREGTLLKHSMKSILSHLHVNAVPANDEQKKCFLNVNSNAELNSL